MKPFTTRLFKKFRNTLLFLFSAIGIIALVYFSQLTVLVIYLYLITFIYVTFYFKEGQDKSSHIYFFVGFMFLIIIAYAHIYIYYGVVDSGQIESKLDKWDHYYFSVVTWTTLGYGDLRPSQESRLYAASQALLGYIYMAFFVAKFFDWMNKRDSND